MLEGTPPCSGNGRPVSITRKGACNSAFFHLSMDDNCEGDTVGVRKLKKRHIGAAMGALCAWADTVVLTNGDRLTGEVLLMDGGTLVLSTEYAGEIRIAWDKVAQLQTDDPMLMRTKALSSEYEARLSSTGQLGTITVLKPAAGTDIAASADEVALADIERLVRPHAFLRDWSFEGGMDVALDATHSSSSNQNWNAALHATARRDWWRHGANLDFARKTQDGIVGTYNYNAAYTLDRFLSEKLFLRGRVRYGRDRIANPANELVFAAGPGYQFWDNELSAFSVSAMLTHTRYKYHDESRDNFQTAGLGWNFMRYLGGKQWQIFTTGEVHRALRSDADHRLEADIGLRYSVTQWMSLYAKAGYNRVSISGQPSTNERTYSLGLGVHW